MKDLLQNFGLKQSEVSIERWKDNVLRVARGLSITNYPLFWLGRSISKPCYDVSRYSLSAVYVFVVVRCFPFFVVVVVVYFVVVVVVAAAAAVDGWPAEFLKCHVKLLIHVQAAMKVFRQCCYFDSQ